MAALERGAGGQIEFSSLAQGPRRYGPEASTAATSGMLPSTGYQQRSRSALQQAAVRARLQQMVATGQLTAEQAARIGGA